MYLLLPALLLSLSLSSSLSAEAIASMDSDPLPPGWTMAILPGAQPGVMVRVLQRTELAPPARYRVVVVPGSGCTGWVPVAPRYFAGLLHAQLLLLHKPGVEISAGLAADCSEDFVANDTLSSWRDHALAALQAHFTPPQIPRDPAPDLPVVLIGISEGAELLPALAERVAGLAGVVMLSSTGLDPRDAGELQALRLGHGNAWRALQDAQASSAREDRLVEGRTLAYWRDFWQWPLAQPLLTAPWPLLRVWGDADEFVPIAAYQRFGQLAKTRVADFCDLRFPGADHGLQSESPEPRDGIQILWARLEAWARHPALGWCSAGAFR